MANGNTYKGKLTARSVRTWLRAIGIVIAGATMVIVAIIIAKEGSGNSDWHGAGKFVGLRHEATTLPPTNDTLPDVSNPDATKAQEPASNTIVRNGITVVSPELLVPALTAELMETTRELQDGGSSGKASKTRKRSRYTKR